jgi:hypothetical protein
MDASIKTKSNTVGAIIKPMAKWKLVLPSWTVSNSGTPTLLRDTSVNPVQPVWEEVWTAEGSNVGGFTFNSIGYLKFQASGIYKISYVMGCKGLFQGTEGWVGVGLYGTNGTVLVPRSFHRESIERDDITYQTLCYTSYIRVTSGGDAAVYAGTNATEYHIGLTQGSGTSNLINLLSELDPFSATFALEYVRAL